MTKEISFRYGRINYFDITPHYVIAQVQSILELFRLLWKYLHR
jgi:hypothetical protein